jgi:hypothetical protein
MAVADPFFRTNQTKVKPDLQNEMAGLRRKPVPEFLSGTGA